MKKNITSKLIFSNVITAIFLVSVFFAHPSHATVSVNCLFDAIEKKYPQHFPRGVTTVSSKVEKDIAYDRKYNNQYQLTLSIYRDSLWYAFNYSKNFTYVNSIEEANTIFAGGNCSIQRCFGAIGNQCDGLEKPFKTAHPLEEQREFISPGSILHDRCCFDHPEGYACKGSGKATSESNLFCNDEWNKAASDFPQYFWRHTFGPYKLDQGDSRTSINDLKAPDETTLASSDEKYCQSGTFRNKDFGYGICGHKVKKCNGLVESGGLAGETHYIDLGNTAGYFIFEYDTFEAKDAFIILYNGDLLYKSGCVGTKGKRYKRIYHKVPLYNSGIYGHTIIKVQVSPNCAGDSQSTEWKFTVHCPSAKN
jgi:hypothetical protein